MDFDSLTYKEAKALNKYPVAKFFSDAGISVLSQDVPEDPGSSQIVKSYRLSSYEDWMSQKSSGSAPKKSLCKFTVSTTTVDLMGDVMSMNALEKMGQAAIGKTYFMNHRYSVPDDVYGKVCGADIVKRAMTDPVTGQQGEYYCLDYTIEVASSNPAAMKCLDLIEKDAIKLGASVSIIITKATPLDNGLQVIDDLYYLECSVVGIPANQACWVDQVGKAFTDFNKAKAKAAPTEEELELEELKTLINAQGELLKSLATEITTLKEAMPKPVELTEVGTLVGIDPAEKQALVDEIASLKQELATKSLEIEQWEAIGPALSAKLKELLDQPLNGSRE